MDLGVIIIAALPSIFSGMTILVVTRQQNKADKRAKDREEREELTLEALNAVFCVTKELTDCVLHDKEPNGELEEAYRYKQEVKHKLKDYQRRKAARY